MLRFFDKLEEKEAKEDVICMLKRERHPILLWGAGDVALLVREKLSQNGIRLSGIIVDMGNSDDVNGEAYNFQSAKKKFGKYVLVIGHSHYELAESIQIQHPEIIYVTYFTSIAYGKDEKISLSELRKRQSLYEEAYGYLADELSRDSMAAYFNARINEDVSYVLPYVCQGYDYFHNDIWTMGAEECYVDVGAFRGETIEEFINAVSENYHRIYAFEPDSASYTELEKRMHGKKNVFLFNYGLWNSDAVLGFNSSGEQGSSICHDDTANSFISVKKLDSVIPCEKITMIKINLFAGMLEILGGGINSIRKAMPKLSLTVGFDEYSIVNIIRFMKENLGQYAVYLRFFAAMSAKLVLLARKKD